jgi:hypothetical protein
MNIARSADGTAIAYETGWGRLKRVAHTLPYDGEIMGETRLGRPLPAARWPGTKVKTLVIVGGKSPAFFHNGTRMLADLLPNAERGVLDGQTHMVKAKVLAPLLIDYGRAGAPGSRDQRSLPARLVEAQHVAGGIAKGAVADAVRLVDRLLQHLGTRGADALERGVAVVGPEDDSAQQALRQQFRHRLLVGGRGVRVREGRFEDEVHVGLRRRPDGHPAHPLEPDVVAHLEAENVPVEGERLVVVVDCDEAL